MQRNQPGQFFHVIAFNNQGRVTGQAANITCTLSIDGGDREPTDAVNPVEIGTTGEYVFALTQAETNGHALSFAPQCSTAGVQVLGMPSNVIYTQNVQAEAAAAITAAELATLAKQNEILGAVERIGDDLPTNECPLDLELY